jgi:hypothetical protein
MPRRRVDPDPELVLAVLDDGERQVVAGWVDALGLDSWTQVPPLRTLLPLVAALRLASDMDDLPFGDALAAACEAIGMEDDSEFPTRPSDSLARTLRRWIGTGQVDRPPRDEVA